MTTDEALGVAGKVRAAVIGASVTWIKRRSKASMEKLDVLLDAYGVALTDAFGEGWRDVAGPPFGDLLAKRVASGQRQT